VERAVEIARLIAANAPLALLSVHLATPPKGSAPSSNADHPCSKGVEAIVISLESATAADTF
jgi:hypothetical protein